jgi:hypothetical protein
MRRSSASRHPVPATTPKMRKMPTSEVSWPFQLFSCTLPSVIARTACSRFRSPLVRALGKEDVTTLLRANTRACDEASKQLDLRIWVLCSVCDWSALRTRLGRMVWSLVLCTTGQQSTAPNRTHLWDWTASRNATYSPPNSPHCREGEDAPRASQRCLGRRRSVTQRRQGTSNAERTRRACCYRGYWSCANLNMGGDRLRDCWGKRW